MDSHGLTHTKASALVVFLVLAVVALGAMTYRVFALQKSLTTLSDESQATEAHLNDLLHDRDVALEELQSDNDDLRYRLDAEQERLKNLGQEVEDLSGTVDDLEKLKELDPQLLQKYSKVFFLNEHYVPKRLVDIDSDYLYHENEDEQILREVRPFLEDMIRDAKRADVDLFVLSAYRSFGTQAALKTGYTVTYGSGANQFSADQGYSEHQLGTTVDFTTTGINGGLDGFQNTPAYEWLVEHAYKYGFVLSYPEGNSYYVFEPWHWRFVGRDLARDLHRKDKYFYDLDQRDIDDYLLEIFD